MRVLYIFKGKLFIHIINSNEIMKEEDMEYLIAHHPEDFFPNSGFILKEQQFRIGGRFVDIVFSDKFDRTIVVEVKGGILSRDASGQIIEYYGLLKQEESNKIIELILCANVIPHERKLFLERAGIECKELGISFIQKIAKKYNYKFSDEEKEQNNKTIEQIKTLSELDSKKSNRVWIFQANPTKYDILNALSDPNLEKMCWQVNQHQREIKKNDMALIWMSGKEGGIYAIAEVISDPQIIADFPAEEKYWVNEKDRGKIQLKVIIKIEINLENNPILREELKNVEELKNLSILKFWEGTNFPVSNEEWMVIQDLIKDRIGQ